jgi:hypothetical protein
MANNIPNGDIGGKDEFMYLTPIEFLILWLFSNNLRSKYNVIVKP